MRKLMIVAATIGLIATTGAALASQETQGKVQTVSTATGTLTLVSGQTFTFSNHNALTGLMPGDWIAVTYSGENEGIAAFNPSLAR